MPSKLGAKYSANYRKRKRIAAAQVGPSGGQRRRVEDTADVSEPGGSQGEAQNQPFGQDGSSGHGHGQQRWRLENGADVNEPLGSTQSQQAANDEQGTSPPCSVRSEPLNTTAFEPSGQEPFAPNLEGATREFNKRFFDNPFGFPCGVCDRLWFLNDLKLLKAAETNVLVGTNINLNGLKACKTCYNSLRCGKIPRLAVSNGFVYPEFPSNPSLPPLDPITERLIAPRLPFMQIRRLRFATGSYGIIGQVINVPVDVDKMVTALPRQLEDDRAFNVAIKKHIIHKSNYLTGLVKKATVKAWLKYLVTTELYTQNNITFDEDRLETIDLNPQPSTSRVEVSTIPLETIESDHEIELLIGQQHTLLWNEDKCLEIAPGQGRVPLSVVYDQHAEELSFPGIYLGHPRTFDPEAHVTPYMMATSELRRRDRRGAKPQHILYVAMKILRLRVRDGLQLTFKCMGTANITRAQLKDHEFVEKQIDRGLSFLKSIPNSVQYWHQCKMDLFAMIRQLGKPTMFLTLSASETKWPQLLQTLHKLSGNGSIFNMQQLTALQKATLVNEDPVTCCIYFNKLVDIIMNLLQSPRYSPFGKYRVVDYFKRIEFQHRGSPHAHIILWLANDPHEAVSENMPKTVQLINDLCSISATDLPDSYGNQVHKHTFTCYKRNAQQCRFNIPYWPMDSTRILLPLPADDGRRGQLKKRSAEIRKAIEIKVFDSFEQFLRDNSCTLEYYLDVIRSSINRPTIVLKRSMSELWTNPFNPWIANILRSNMDLQVILDEFSCAAYVVEYVNKTNRGFSHLHRELIKLQEQFPDQDYAALLKKVSIKMLNSVEMSAQEAAWYLLRQAMAHGSRKVLFIPTMWPHERIKSRKRNQQMDDEQIGDDSTDVWTENIVEKYETREGLDDVCLADFVAHYTKIGRTNGYKLRSFPCVLRWCAYSMDDLPNYKREMVLLFLPFRVESRDVLDRSKYLELYDQNQAEILRKCKEYSAELDLERTVQEYLRMFGDDETNDVPNAASEKLSEFIRTIAMHPNDDDIEHLPIGALSAVVKQRTNVMSKQDYCAMVRSTNAEQRDLVLQVIHGLHSFDGEYKPLQIFFTGPAGCGKTFTLRVLMETYNRFSQAQNSQRNAYVACASTGKAAVALNGTTVHSAFRITMTTRRSLGSEARQLYRNAFANVKVVFVDEVSMLSAEILNIIDARLRAITGNYDDAFGGFNIIFCGDLRQLPPVCAKPVYLVPKDSMHGAVLWQSLDFFPLVKVMRQTHVEFSSILTKIGNGDQLTVDETKLIESRFRTAEWCKQNVSGAVRLFHRNTDVENYNREALEYLEGVDCIAEDAFSGYRNAEQLASSRIKLYKMSVADTGCLPYMVRLSVGMPYMISTNIDVEDGIVNGAIGELKFIEYNDNDPQRGVCKLWIKFDTDAIGAAVRIKSRPAVFSRPGVLQPDWTPISKRSANIKLDSVKCKRVQFPVVSASALTVHKSQGGTFSEIVYDYDKGQEQQLVYVGLSRVTSLDGLYLTNKANNFKFFHAKGSKSKTTRDLKKEFLRLATHRLRTLADDVMDAIENCETGCTLMSINVQSLQAHSLDIASDRVLTKVDLLALSETWLDDQSCVEIEGYRMVVQSKRTNVRAGGVALYEKIASSTVATPCVMTKLSERYDAHLLAADDYGDICGAIVEVMGTPTMVVSVYISPDTTMKQKELFIARSLMNYSRQTMPIVVTGDFNINIRNVENDETTRFIDFMHTHLRLTLATNPAQSTTLGGTCIDLTFVRNIRAVCTRYCSYFSYHRPILSVLEI